MKINRKKLELAMARRCADMEYLVAMSGVPRPTLNGAASGRSVRPVIVGRIAKALKVDPADIIEKAD